MKNKHTSPWAWIPTLYFAQGLPYVAVKDLAEKAAEAFSYGDNMRAGGEYRRHLAQVSIRRLMEQISREEEK